MVTRLLRELSLQHTPIAEVGESEENTAFAGKSFCVTGSFPNIPRDEIHTIIEQNGGEVRTSVSPKLDYLIA